MDINEIRRIRLEQWFADRPFPKEEKSYLSQIINKKTVCGEKAARRLEDVCGMGANYLDQPLEADDRPVVSKQALEVAKAFDKLPAAEKPVILRAVGVLNLARSIPKTVRSDETRSVKKASLSKLKSAIVAKSRGSTLKNANKKND